MTKISNKNHVLALQMDKISMKIIKTMAQINAHFEYFRLFVLESCQNEIEIVECRQPWNIVSFISEIMNGV